MSGERTELEVEEEEEEEKRHGNRMIYYLSETTIFHRKTKISVQNDYFLPWFLASSART